MGTVVNSLTELPVTILIVPARSAKKSRPSGAHASAVANLASLTSVLCPDGPLTLTAGVSHELRGAEVDVSGTVVVVDDGAVRLDSFEPPPLLHALSVTTIRKAAPINGRAGFGTWIPSESS